ncbi:ABC transporter permease [Mycolicibacterium vaccae]|uniref:Binding-protein-dependent transport systems inner membrane component n=1 Tax=Mycolicibacterium vaccae ATCC 25954 TaxID=1194972 RepID=K0UXH0_MYCVA|nr:ABC transporter permease [Mycolicibacterium vaccae]ANI37338.1 ABC transporter permease [Mycolicibacterium vaccae 95051]EJZ11446.1 binding-protein-dependent transport systems inner membrane component [Mycolicibacterium vaccae ATCC 25954]MCV7064216.1 ABC transporter permease [Mycolicibacterium vaccae]
MTTLTAASTVLSTGRGRTMLGVIGAFGALAAWFLLSANSGTAYFPPLSAIIAEAAEYWTTPQGLANIQASLTTLSAGLAIAIILGVTVGLVIGQLPIVERMVSPTLEFARAIPSTALIPFAMMLFGVSPEMKIFLIALGCVWPVLLSTADGARRLDATMVASARAFNITGPRRQFYVVLPAVLPRVLVGVRIAIPLSLILMVTSEMVGAQKGLGFVITQAQATFQLLTMWSGILVLGILGFLMTFLYSLVERRLLRWSDPRRSDTR